MAGSMNGQIAWAGDPPSKDPEAREPAFYTLSEENRNRLAQMSAELFFSLMPSHPDADRGPALRVAAMIAWSWVVPAPRAGNAHG